jgi:hypothetical protein
MGMRRLLFILIVTVGIGCAQSKGKEDPAAEPDRAKVEESVVVLCRLETVTWNPQTEELSWVVSIHNIAGDDGHPAVQQKYTIRIDGAVMSYKGEDRHFDPAEARRVVELMNVISSYAVESTIWWTDGEDEKPAGKDSISPGNKDKSKEKPEPIPAVRVPVAFRTESPARRWFSAASQLP